MFATESEASWRKLDSTLTSQTLFYNLHIFELEWLPLEPISLDTMPRNTGGILQDVAILDHSGVFKRTMPYLYGRGLFCHTHGGVTRAIRWADSRCILPRTPPGTRYPSTLPIASVPRLPLEICEEVIRNIPYEHRNTISACSLVCRGWSRISILRLFEEVTLDSHRRISLFRSAVSASPGLGQRVRYLRIHGSASTTKSADGWIYDVLRYLPPFLPNLRHLCFSRLPTLHPIFIPLCSRFTSVRVLKFFSLTNQSLREIIQIANRFKGLRDLGIEFGNWPQSAPPWNGQSHLLECLDVNVTGTAVPHGQWTTMNRWIVATHSSLSLIKLRLDTLELDLAEMDQTLQLCPRLEAIQIAFSSRSTHPLI